MSYQNNEYPYNNNYQCKQYKNPQYLDDSAYSNDPNLIPQNLTMPDVNLYKNTPLEITQNESYPIDSSYTNPRNSYPNDSPKNDFSQDRGLQYQGNDPISNNSNQYSSSQISNPDTQPDNPYNHSYSQPNENYNGYENSFTTNEQTSYQYQYNDNRAYVQDNQYNQQNYSQTQNYNYQYQSNNYSYSAEYNGSLDKSAIVTSINNNQSNYNGYENQGNYNGYQNQGSYNGYQNQGSYNSYQNQGSYNGYQNQSNHNGYQDQSNYNGYENQGNYNGHLSQGSYGNDVPDNQYNTYKDSQNYLSQPDQYGSQYGSYKGSSMGDWGMAPPVNSYVQPVAYNEINYHGMQFPEFQKPAQSPSEYQTDPNFSGNVPYHENVPQYLQNYCSNLQLSNCNGRKRALLIGINYINTKYRLKGCINDVHRMKKFIMEHFEFKEADMVILTDDQKNPNRLPTRENILKAMKWLVHDAQPNDSFFFHFSGHGSRIESTTGDEIDGQDDTICPLDFEENGQIIDDDMNAIMVRPLPAGSRLTAIYDCCHSASALSLPFKYGTNGKLKYDTGLKVAGSSIKDAGLAYLKGDIESALGGLTLSVRSLISGDQLIEKARNEKSSIGDVIMFSGCKDTQTSADAKEDLSFTGAMSWALTSSLYENPHQTYVQLLKDIRARLADKYTQLPQLSTGRLMDMDTIFIM
ncbi:Metacaspase-1 [Smittium culicis]|uniref:Metacaspase-1 n=1 Tax=Smittium culicis TaxID=133412 RepID=A0A1R1Y6R9_9FUNG|nr:Metacaspase-1 [Smittium culicis]